MVDHSPTRTHPVFRHGQRMTLDEYFQLPETTIHTELIDGMLYVYDGQEGNMPAPTPQHQQVVMSIVTYLLPITSKNGLYTAPVDVVLGDDVVQPDILWVSATNTGCRITDRRIVGAPDLIVEILSPSTHKQDRVAKFNLYEAHGVGEYWIVDPDVQIVEVYIRQDDRLHRQGGYSLGDKFVSQMLNNAQIDVSMLFR